MSLDHDIWRADTFGTQSHLLYVSLLSKKTTNHFNLLEEKEKSSDDIAQILGLDRPPPV